MVGLALQMAWTRRDVCVPPQSNEQSIGIPKKGIPQMKRAGSSMSESCHDWRFEISISSSQTRNSDMPSKMPTAVKPQRDARRRRLRTEASNNARHDCEADGGGEGGAFFGEFGSGAFEEEGEDCVAA